MNACELKSLIDLATDVESEMSLFYEKLAGVFMSDERARQFFLLMSFDERTHAQMLTLVTEKLDPLCRVPATDVPRPLTRPDALEHMRQWIRMMSDLITDSKLDLGWALRVAAELENSEVEAITAWLLALPVPPETRSIIDEMMAGTTDHVHRVREFMAHHNQLAAVHP